ncbi:MAG: M1 family aminopeptidase [Bacteroidales bacterium]
MKKISLLMVLSVLFLHTFSQSRTDTIHVAHYNINLSILDFSNRTIEGYTNLSVVSLIQNLSAIHLDLKSLTIDSILINRQSVPYSYQNERIEIPVSGYHLSDTIPLTIYYHGTPSQDPYWGGFYFSGETAYNLGVGFADIPHNYGRVWYPCIDMFTDKSTYTFHIRTANGKKAICGGELIDSTLLEDHTTLWSWQLNQPIPTYLASVAVGEYQLYQDTCHVQNGILPITLYAPSSHLQQVPGSFINLKKMIRNYENKFGPIGWERVGYVLVNFNNGAMEHATNIAYPASFVNGNTTYQGLIAHELAHAWFGNLVTCERAEEMWINEGFARYAEALTDEILFPNEDPELDGYKANIRELHRKVLKNIAIDDHGHYALNQVPLSVTYGSTSYDKGALVVHTLRNYLGDSLFFSGLTSMLHHYDYQNIGSEELFEYLSQITGTSLHSFYEGWVNQPGYLHFSIDSIQLDNCCTNQYSVYVRQRLYEANHFADENKIDLTFFSVNGEEYTYPNFKFSGETGMIQIVIPFEPLFGVVDFHEKIADAVIDYNKKITIPNTYLFPDANCTVKINHISEPSLLRVEHNLVAPDPLKVENPDIYHISENHYWRIEKTPSGNLDGYFQFKFSAYNSDQLDYTLLHNQNINDLVLLYRRNSADDWRIPYFTRGGSSTNGYLRTEQMLPGEYTFGLGNSTLQVTNNDSYHFFLFPNPTHDMVQISIDTQEIAGSHIEVINYAGKLLLSKKLTATKTTINLKEYPAGIYFIKLYSNKRLIKTSKISKL